MALKKYTFSEQREFWLLSFEKQLLQIRFSYYRILGQDFGYQLIMDKLFNRGTLASQDLDENIRQVYGFSDEENTECKIVKILFLIFLIMNHNIIYLSDGNKNEFESKTLTNNIMINLKKYLPEYKIGDFVTGEIPKYESTEIKAVIDNLKDIPNELANPIAQLLYPTKNEDELIGLISKVYKDIEKISKNQKDKLNEVDKSILNNAQKLAKMLANNVDGAKGHKGESELTVKDIAHNFALNASLIQKLIQINNNKKE